MNINLTLIGQTVIFAAFVWFCMKFIWPPIVEAMATRAKQIADGLAAAEKGYKAQELAQIEADKLIVESREQAAEIINQANVRGSEMVDEAKDKANNEAKSVKDKAKSDIVTELNSARENLRKEVSSLVLKGVRQIVSREVTEADHKEVLSSLSEKL